MLRPPLALEPPERLTPSQAAAKYRILQIPGAYNGPYLNETTPYMIEPLDCQADPTIRAIVFVGGAQIDPGSIEHLKLADQHVGQDGQRVAPLHDARHGLQGRQNFFLRCLQDNHVNLLIWSF